MPSLVEIGPEILEKKDVKITFRYFTNIFPLKMAWPFI